MTAPKNERDALLDTIIALELEMFLATPNEGGVSPCQQHPETFRVMRRMMYIIHDTATLRSYLHDLQEAAAAGRNVMIEKYARMENRIPPLSNDPLLDEIVAGETAFLEAGSELMPDMIQKGAKTYFQCYLRAELETLSPKTLALYAKTLRAAQKNKRNLAIERHEFLAKSLAVTPAS